MAGQAAQGDDAARKGIKVKSLYDAAPVDAYHVREVSIGKSCYKKSSLHVWCTGMAGQAAHEDDAAPVMLRRIM